MLKASLVVFLASTLPAFAGGSPFVGSNIVWSACGDSAHSAECGKFRVPLDYHDISAGDAQLAVVRVNATNMPRLGTLFLNPGGPGNGGVSWLLGDDLDLLIENSGGQYDLVSWDPRGTGSTKPRVKCFDSLSEAHTFWNGSIRGSALEVRDDFTNITARSEFFSHINEVDDSLVGFYEHCDSKSMHMLQYVGTPATVRDMVQLHDYLDGNKEINYWGFSYGTLLGNYFVNMFPERVGRVILDGVLDPWVWSTKPPLDSISVIVTDTEEVFHGFAKYCADAGPTKCAIAQNGSTAESISEWTLNLIKIAYDNTQAASGTVTTSGVLRAQIWAGMYRPVNWKALAQFLHDTSDALRNSSFTSDPTIAKRTDLPPYAHPFSKISYLRERRADNDTDDQTNPDLDFSPQAIACSDSINSPGVTTQDVFDFEVNVIDSRTKILGPVTWLLPDTYCHRWPARAVERYDGNYYDPVTPLASARRVADAFGESAVLLERNAYGHTSLGMHSNCTNTVVSDYLNRKKLPPAGLVCKTDQDLF